MTKKCFATIKSAQEIAKKITTITDELKATNAYNSAKEIATLTTKFMNDFGNVDPAWKPNGAKNTKSMTKKCFACIKTAQETNAKINELLSDLKVTNAYKSVKAVAELNNKFIEDFGNVDPAWKPEQTQTPEPQITVEPAYDIEEEAIFQ